uniref:Placenta growth factor n=1 Tax=Zeugodacus cucurbitae TaxID=28588 RepID=A0A0A1WHD7_ZEUCU
MARSNVNNNIYHHNNNNQRSDTSRQWHILALFAVLFCCNASLPTAFATVVGKRVDSSSSTEANVDAVDSVTTADAADATASIEDVDGVLAKRSAENLQLSHVFRHQEHYSHRIEQAVNDLKRTQLQQQLSGNYSNTTESSGVNGDNSGINNNNNNYMHYESQLQPRLSERLRHHNQRHHSLAPVSAWERYMLPPLRHQRHQQQTAQQQNQQPEYVADATMVVTTSPLMPLSAPTATEAANDGVGTNEQSNILPAIMSAVNGSSVQQQPQQQHIKPHRYFDRDGLYQSSSYIWTTRGPKVRFDANYWKTKEFSSGKQTDSQRISLDLNAEEEDASYTPVEQEGLHAGERKYKTNEAQDNDSEIVNDANDSSSDDYDDYSYEEDSTEAVQSANEFPNANNIYEGAHRTAVKRYTNPFNDLRLPPKKRDYSPHPYASIRRRADPATGAGGGGNDGNTYANFGVDTVVVDNGEAEFSSEKWQRIEQEHHRKQQEHQRQMMALRARHDGKYRPTAAAATATPLIMAATTTQQRQHDDEDSNNINSQYYIPGTLTRQKQEELGTIAAVQETRRSHAVKHKHEKALAGEHVKQILSEAACRVPQRRVERIQRDPSKTYMPHCTVLHRCTDETGCCRSERQTCAPKRTKNVDLYFYVRSINEKRGTVERLTFINHTECHCVDKSRQQVDEYHNMAMYDMNYGGQTLRRATILNCNCPKLYEKILQEDGFCRCDCSSGNTGCDWLKRGMEHFSVIDRKCITEGRCKPPTCEHGNYIKKYGRCPRREEQLPAALTEPVMLATNALAGSDYH